MSDDDPTGRTLRLLGLLQSRRDWTVDELAGRLGTSGRTVRRDVRRLRDLGYAVAGSPGPGAAYRLEAGSRLPPLLLDEEEVLAVVAGLRLVEHDLGEDAAPRALAKLERVLPRTAADRLRQVAGTTEAGRPHDPEESTTDLAAVEQLTRAAVDGGAVGFDFVDRFGVGSRRRVLPYRQLVSRGRWYLVAHDLDRDGWRTFRLDRVTAIEELPGRFVRPELPFATVAEYFATDFGRLRPDGSPAPPAGSGP